jgi:hypothetical protein
MAGIVARRQCEYVGSALGSSAQGFEGFSAKVEKINGVHVSLPLWRIAVA